MKQLELRDFLKYKFLSGLKYAPGGKRAAFVAANCTEDGEGYESRIYLYENGEARPLTDIGKEKGFIWEDEQRLLFPAVRSAKEKKRAEAKEGFTSYYMLDLRGGEAMPAFTLPFAAGSIRRLGEGVYAVTGTIDVHCPDYYRLSEEERREYAKKQGEEKDYEVLDESPFWMNGGGMRNKKRTALFLVHTQPMQVERVTNAQTSVGSMAVLGEHLYYTASEYAVKPARKGCKVWRLNWKTGENVLVAQDEELSVGSLECVGGQVWCFGSKHERHGNNENAWVYVLNEETGGFDLLRREEYSMYGSVGSDCRYGGGESRGVRANALYYTTTRSENALLYRMNADGTDAPVITKEGSIDCVAVCEESAEILLVAMYDMKLQELYSYDLESGELRQRTQLNEEALKDTYVAQAMPISVESEGYTIAGRVLLPKDFDPEKKYPAVLDIHGGPKTAYGPVFYHEMQLWANMGYFVFYCNPKGSDGGNGEFMDIRGHYGETDYKNLMDFTDAVLAAYPQIDPARVCETGGSYGGFMTNWIIGHTDRFCCTASQRSISNWLSFYGVSDIGPRFGEDQCGGTPFDDVEKLWRQSPLKYAKNVKTPTLFIHSDEDYRCPLEQGLQMYTALAEMGVPTRMCLFHGENHELSRSGKPRHRIRRLQEITDWFEKYTR
ncbi:MAG: S9 family peptidase [Eubacteriales bacterium]|nr:S9 family peptidase [Eubacteriales bacterium]